MQTGIRLVVSEGHLQCTFATSSARCLCPSSLWVARLFRLVSSFTRTQVAAVFATAILSVVPAVNFSGLFAPVSSLSGTAKIIGLTFPSAWYQPITVGVFAKALGMSALWFNVIAICIIAVAYLILSLLFLRKQEA
jgi:ribosome-dependent ATPase